MKRSIIINKGSAQVTIPKALAESLGLVKGAKVDIKLEENRIVIIPLDVVVREARLCPK